MTTQTEALDCELLLKTQQQNFLGDRRIGLLEQIDASGSISRAARQLGMSYKAAWDAVDAMNNLSRRPLVTRSAGGVNGGGSEVTRYGRDLIRSYRALQQVYRNALQLLGDGADGAEQLQQLSRILGMKTSARNQFQGKVSQVTRGAVSGDVVIDIGDGLEIFANISKESIEQLGLCVGKDAVAIIKSSLVILSPDRDLRISARNRLPGKVIGSLPGVVNSEVKIELAGGRVLTAVITNESLKELGFAPGSDCCALIKASHVIVAVND